MWPFDKKKNSGNTGKNTATPEDLNLTYGHAMGLLMSMDTHQEAVRLLNQLESKGYAEAGVILGQLCQGDDIDTACKHFEIAAAANIAEGAWGVSGCLEHNHIPDPDDEDDVLWVKNVKQAAKGGSPDAMNELGNIYSRQGYYLPAMFWYQKAELYENGEGTYGVRAIARRWAGAGRPEDCPTDFGKSDLNCARLFMLMELRENISSVIEKLSHLALENDTAALFLAKSFEYAQQIPEAIRWYNVAVQSNEPQALRCMADMYMAGEHISKDMNLAMSYYKTAAAHEEKIAQFVMGEYYRSQGNLDLAGYYYGMSHCRGCEYATTRLQQIAGVA